jgi:hypothetical protein
MTMTDTNIIGYIDDHGTVTYEQIRSAMQGKPYRMELVSSDAAAVIAAVNQGIDSHLEACYRQETDTYEPIERRLDPCSRFPEGAVLATGIRCSVSPESLPTLLRRLYDLPTLTDLPPTHRLYVDEVTADAGFSLACDIVDTLLSPEED